MPDGLEDVWRFDEGVPGCAGCVYDLFVGFPDLMGEAVGAQIGPEVLDWVEFGGIGRQGQQHDVAWHLQTGRAVPACAVHDQQGDGAWTDAGADRGQMLVHGLDADDGQHHGAAYAAGGAEGAEQIDPVESLVAQRAGAGAATRPDAGQRALLADPGFVLEPDLDRPAGVLRAEGVGSKAREVFLKASWVARSVCGCSGRTESLR